MNRYHFFDRTIESDVLFPELRAATGSEPPGIVICAGTPEVKYQEQVHRWVDDDVLELSCDRHGQWYRLELPGEAVAHIHTGDLRIVYEEGDGLDLPTLRHFIIDQALPRLIGHIGGLVLHGGCVSKDSTTIALLGETGSGKSTLCASFLKDGWTVMSDDCVLVEAGERPVVSGAYGGIRLYPDAISNMGLQDVATAPMAAYSDKKRICVSQDAAVQDSSLSLVVALVEGETIAVQKLSGANALMELVAGSFSLAPADSDLAAGKVGQYAKLLDDGLVVVRCTFPQDYQALSSVKQSIVDALGLLE